MAGHSGLEMDACASCVMLCLYRGRLAVARTLDDEVFGQDSRRMKVGSFAMMCRSLIHCKTLKSALLRMLQFSNLLLDDYHSSLVSEGTFSRIVIQERFRGQTPRVFGHETLLMMRHGLACWLVGRRIPILADPLPRLAHC